jgi:photosystem II stability/assembly factor-like uncharacterized protein
MEEKRKYEFTVIDVAGSALDDLHVLANLYEPPMDPEEITSVVYAVTYEPDTTINSEFRHVSWFTAMKMSDDKSLFAVTMDGELHFRKEGKWDSVSLDVKGGLKDLWLEDGRSVYCVSEQGEIVHVTFDSRMKMMGQDKFVDPEKRDLFAIHGTSSKKIMAVGSEGVVYEYNGKTWKEVESGTNLTLMTVLGVSESESYFGGVRGLLFKYDGKEIEKIETDDKMSITGMAMYQGELHVATGKDGVQVVRKGALEKIRKAPLHHLVKIGDYLVGNGEKLVAYTDGKGGWWGGDLEL